MQAELCAVCDGTGIQDCPECDVYGDEEGEEDPCFLCGGAEEIECLNCDGSGTLDEDDEED